MKQSLFYPVYKDDAPIESMIALCDMIDQFAYRSRPYRGKETLCHGGLSALENAFFAIGLMGAKFTADGRLRVSEVFRIMEELDNKKSDIQEVVHCKDCKYFSEFQHCDVLGFCEPNEYCRRGKRRKEDD